MENVEQPQDQLAASVGKQARRGSVIDLFCGAGGLSHGFFLEGYNITAGVDTDEACRYAFETNNDAPLIRKSVEEISGAELSSEFVAGQPKILVGCAPCQPFSKYSQGRDDPRWALLDDFARLIEESEPDIVSMENVPRLKKFQEGRVFKSFVERLERNQYQVSSMIAYCPDFGVPQSRSRLVLLASRHSKPRLPQPTHTTENYLTVEAAIGELPPINSGETNDQDPLHRASRLSATNLERIQASRPGGTWRDWSDHLVTDCHQKETGRGYSSVYGRMGWNEPSPTMTTQFFGFGNGRFGHPSQDRAISLREGALLQTFPRNYEFLEPGARIHMKTLGRLIGNAVPVALGRAIARAVAEHIEENNL
jgi:DNA (cytosine-5)-methyltransferase 1